MSSPSTAKESTNGSPNDQAPNELFDLGALGQEALDSLYRYERYSRFLKSSWKETGAYFVFLVAVATLVQMIFGVMEVSRFYAELATITEVIPDIRFSQGSYTADVNLPYSAEHNGLLLQIDPTAEALPDGNAPVILLGRERMMMSRNFLGLSMMNTPIADWNFTLDDAWLHGQLQEMRLNQMSNMLVMALLSLAFGVAFLSGLTGLLLWAAVAGSALRVSAEQAAFLAVRGVTLPVLVTAFLPMQAIVFIPPAIFFAAFVGIALIQCWLGLRHQTRS